MIKTKMLAVLMVSLMMAVSVVPILGEDDEVSAAVGDGGYYSYTLNYHADQMTNTAAQELQLTVNDMTPISHNSGVTTLQAVDNVGSWGWNITTGIGPFNSFYAAFDMTDGNKFVSILNPYDLTKKIDGTALDDMTKYNIMWVLPTVYWYTDDDGNLTLTNDPESGGVAYAHTMNGRIREYVAYGVYEASTKTINERTVLTSETNATPIVNVTRNTLRSYSGNYTMDESLNSSSGLPAYSTLWNFFQWQLYKYCSYVVMEGFNSQAIAGNGSVSGLNFTVTTGQTNTLGPYAGNPTPISNSGTTTTGEGLTDPVKLFIENSWGGCAEFVDNFTCTNYHAVASTTYPVNTTIGTDGVFDLGAMENTIGGTYQSISTDEKLWGFVIDNSGSHSFTQNNTGLCDYSNYGSSNSVFYVGGSSGMQSSPSYSVYAGISMTYGGGNNAFANVGSRLVFVYGDALPEITVEGDTSGYGTVNSGSTVIPSGEIITIDGNAITVGSDTYTATPNAQTVEYTYSFDGWYNGSTLIPDGTLTVTGDMTITAHFSQALRNYTVNIGSANVDYGTVSSTSLQIPYGTTVSSSNNTLTFATTPDATVVTATPTTSDAQYTYAFSDWTNVPVGGTVTEDLTITANFTQTLNSYTITWVIGETSTTETYDYGEMPTHENPTPPEGYYFAGWNPEIATVTGDQTYTAVFSNMTVTFDAGKGTLDGGASKVVVIGQPIGELPECTPPTNYTFDGWYTAASGGTKVTEDTIVTQEASFTLYAHYELVPALQPVKAILDILPILMAVGLILGAVYVFITRPELATGNNLLYAIVGISVAVLMMAVFVIPIIGSAL